jgi:predicted phage-related endonuclease
MSLSPEALAERKLGIGGSDAAKICSGDWYNLWLDKTGRSEPEDLSANFAVQLGVVTEALNLDWYVLKGGTLAPRGGVYIHPEHSFMRCTLDGWDPTIPAVIEAKHVNGFSKLPDVVERYTPQVMHQMIVTEIPNGFLSIIIGTNEPVVVPVEYDAWWAEEYIGRCREFWAYVVEDKEPPGAPSMEAPPPPIDKMRVVDMSTSNAWANHAANWLETYKSAAKCEAAKKELKALVEADVREAKGHGVIATRDKRGITIKECET